MEVDDDAENTFLASEVARIRSNHRVLFLPPLCVLMNGDVFPVCLSVCQSVFLSVCLCLPFIRLSVICMSVCLDGLVDGWVGVLVRGWTDG